MRHLRRSVAAPHAPAEASNRAAASGEQVRWTHEPDGLDTIPPAVGYAGYRVVQEALTNARRHGGSVSRVDVRVHRAQDRLEVEVLDDGDGPSTPADSSEPSPGSPGHGLVGMRERVASHGGTLETGPRADGGFRVRAVLPIRNGEP